MQKGWAGPCVCSRGVSFLDLWEVTSVICLDKTSDWEKTCPGERILSCVSVQGFFCTSHKYSAANSSGYKPKTYMILLSAKHLCCHLNSQSENLPNQLFFYCCSRQSFLETKSHSRINKCWSESSISRGWFAGQEFKFSLSEAACSLLKHYVHPYAAVRQHLCHWGRLPLESWTQAATKSGMAIHGSVSSSAKQLVPSALLGTACCSFSISCKKDAQVLPFSLPTALIQSRKVAFSPPSCNVSSLWVAAVGVEKISV